MAGKQWLTAEDDAVSEVCTESEAAGIIALDAPFPPLGLDGPPNHPNCRCSILPVLADEMPGEKTGEKAALEKGHEDQPRDERGRWTDGSGRNGDDNSSHPLSDQAYQTFAAGPKEAVHIVAVVSPEVASLLGTRAAEVRLSGETAAKQLRRHPDVKAADYQQIPKMLESGEVRTDKARHFVLLQEGNRMWHGVVKVTEAGDQVWLQTLHRTHSSQIERTRSRSSLIRSAKKKNE